jgi:hypothetical protein
MITERVESLATARQSRARTTTAGAGNRSRFASTARGSKRTSEASPPSREPPPLKQPGREEENTALVRAVFEELAQTQPTDLRYAVFYVPGSRQFVHLYTDEGSPSGVPGLASFKDFVKGVQERHEQPAVSTRPELIGDYRTFDDRDRPAP